MCLHRYIIIVIIIIIMIARQATAAHCYMQCAADGGVGRLNGLLKRSREAPYWDLPKANVLAAPTPPPLLGGAPYWSGPYWPRPYWAALTGHRRSLLERRHRRCRHHYRPQARPPRVPVPAA